MLAPAQHLHVEQVVNVLSSTICGVQSKVLATNGVTWCSHGTFLANNSNNAA